MHDQTAWVVEAFAVLEDELWRCEDEAERADRAWRASMPGAA